jgi:DNA-binding PadR family transcriptional regulator
LDNKKLHFYTITKNGKEELKKIINWIELIKKLLKEVNHE